MERKKGQRGPAEAEPSLGTDKEALERYAQGFRAGYARLGIRARSALRNTLFAHGMTRWRWERLLNGRVEPTVREAALVARVFAGWGITDPWGPGTRHVTVPRKGTEEGGGDE